MICKHSPCFECLQNIFTHSHCKYVVFAGILEVLHCVLVESPEALNIIKEGHIKSIISLLDKHGRNHKVFSSIYSPEQAEGTTNRLRHTAAACECVHSVTVIHVKHQHNVCVVFTMQVLDVLCSLCVCHGVAVRSNQHLICDNLLPGRDLLLQTRLVNHVNRYTNTHTHTHTQAHTCTLTHTGTHTHTTKQQIFCH